MIGVWQAIGAVAVTALVSGGGAGWFAYGAGQAAEQAAQAREDKAAKDARDAALQVTAEAIAGIRVKNTTIRGEVRREVVEKPVYRDCVHSAEQLQRLNDAITGAKPAGGGVVP